VARLPSETYTTGGFYRTHLTSLTMWD